MDPSRFTSEQPYYLQHYSCSGTLSRPRGERRKGLTRIGTLWKMPSRQFLPSPESDVPPLRIAGIVCEETRWRKKKSQKVA